LEFGLNLTKTIDSRAEFATSLKLYGDGMPIASFYYMKLEY